ncbi:MAG TPA: bifunctional precorrin-2 dehydrogenase/sirohydrochlorin ferrochelatase [Candidatus Rifleibacterium sp.]|nr:bifunctional precorrin-2 dehydrogenase/sirohydrochlorin ferrochelatase [Candidatus Rifleibacterium sp.]HPT45328.1 bifunctional precorrin-2 dehydrogenase/sirohydrochlorin ferrochelatase [Candidatus Rifleibacterium sp.]
MKYMPLFIDLHDREILVIGGGHVALRRGRQYVEAGARLTVVAPEILPELAALPRTTVQVRPAGPADVERRYFMVLIASSDPATNDSIAAACRQADLLFNRSDRFEDGNFIHGSLVSEGDIINATVAGGVPAVSQYLQKKIGGLLTPELLKLSALLVELRPAIIKSQKSGKPRQKALADLVNDATLARLRDEPIENIRQEILAWL